MNRHHARNCLRREAGLAQMESGFGSIRGIAIKPPNLSEESVLSSDSPTGPGGEL
ncbi:hypothetical protein BDW75DRAFT_208620 [Aspergillus navahoensis]